MKAPWISVAVVVACGGFQAATHRTSGAAAVAGKELQVEIQWPGSKPAIEVPLEMSNELPIVRCRLNGKEAVLYVDTGSHAISLYEDRLARFGLKVTSEEDWPQYTTGGLVTRTRFCNEFLLAFKDGLNLEASGAACLPAAGRSPGQEVDGLLGVKIMRALNGVIDLGASKITFAVKAAPKSGAANGSQPTRSETNRTPPAAGSRR
jgi:hypothetical protein